MKNMMKKSWAVLLVFCMALFCISASAFASDVEGTGYVASLTNGETVSYYATLEEAVTAAQSAGGTVKLLDSVTLSNSIEIADSWFDIDLNGKTVTSAGYAFEISYRAYVTITSTVPGGRIEANKNSAFI